MGSLTEMDVNNLSELENARMITNMSEIMFHDFKNILAIISGLSQLSILMTESEQVKDNLSYIAEASFELKDSLDRFYNFTKGNDEDTQKSYLLNKIIDEAVELVKFKFDALNNINHKVNLNLIISTSARVFCNKHELKQSLLNILMNAIDSMEETGGTLTISTYNNDDIVNIEIIDSGVGISKENLKRLFKESFTTKEKGTGLGLKIAKNTIEKFKGSIHLNSKLGLGTKVCITLPICNDNNIG